jgi:hypothetical protein
LPFRAAHATIGGSAEVNGVSLVLIGVQLVPIQAITQKKRIGEQLEWVAEDFEGPLKIKGSVQNFFY